MQIYVLQMYVLQKYVLQMYVLQGLTKHMTDSLQTLQNRSLIVCKYINGKNI